MNQGLGPGRARVLRFGPFQLDAARRELQRDGIVLTLPARTFECLHYLIEHRDRAVGRDELVRAVFSRPDVSDAQLAQIVLRTRRAIGDDGQEQRAIRTVPRFGFRWAAPVTVVDEASTPQKVEPARPTDAARDATPAPPIPRAPAIAARAPGFALQARARRRIGAETAVVATALLALASLIVLWSLLRPGRVEADARIPASREAATAGAQPDIEHPIVVLPMRLERPGDAAWARLGMMDLVVDRMRRSRQPVLSSETTLRLLPPGDARPHAERLRRSTHAAWIVDGHARNDGRQWHVVLAATDGAGVVQRGIAQHAVLADATRQATDLLLAAIDPPGPSHDTASDLDARLRRSQSALQADDLDSAKAILLAAPTTQRAHPRLQYELARIDFLAGRYAPALAATDRLLQANTLRHDALLQGELLSLQGSLRMRLGRLPDAERSFDAAVTTLERAGDAAALGDALMDRGVAHSAQREFDPALADLGSARVQLLRAGDRLAVARVDGNLGAVEMERDRPLQALEYFRTAERDFAAMGATTELNGVRFMLAAAHLQLLQPAAALAVSERAWAQRGAIHDPVQRAELILVRAEALSAVGRMREARDLLQRRDADPGAGGDFGRREFLLMELARLGGDARSTALLGTAALRDWPAERNPRLRAWVAFRRSEAALDANLPLPGDDAPLLAGDALAQQLGAALRARRGGDDAAAERAYHSADALAESGGVPGAIANAVRAHARWLMQRGRLTQAAALIGRVAPWAEQDFEVALLQVELYARLRQAQQWKAALDHAQQLAGERPIPAELSLPWAAATGVRTAQVADRIRKQR